MWPFSLSHGAYGPPPQAEISIGYDLPFDRFSTAIDERLLIRPFDLDLLRRSPWGLFQRDCRFIHRQAIVPGTVERRKGFELIERAFLPEHFGVGLDRNRRIEKPWDTVHCDFLGHRMGCRIGSEKIAGFTRRRRLAQRRPV